MRINILWTGFLALALGLSACRSAVPQPTVTPPVHETSSPQPTATSTNTPVPPTETTTPTLEPTTTSTATETLPQDCSPGNYPSGYNPLTCKPPENLTLLERRPIAVKIQTFPRTQRPTWAVSKADIVYDYYQNDGLTRLYAIFYGYNPEKVGPVRSARLFDEHLTSMYETVFAFVGADRTIYNQLLNSVYFPFNRLILEGSNLCPVMCREDPERFNFLFANPQAIGPYFEENGGDNTRQPLEGMTFEHQTPEGGEPEGENVYIRYSISSYVHWEYDPENGTYLRWQDSVEAHTREEEEFEKFEDPADSNQQIATENVIVLKANHDTVTYGRGIVDIELNGKGEAFAFRDGEYYELTWTRPNSGMLTLMDADGNPYAFKPGTTWFQVVGQFSTNEPTEDNGRRFEFRIP